MVGAPVLPEVPYEKKKKNIPVKYLAEYSSLSLAISNNTTFVTKKFGNKKTHCLDIQFRLSKRYNESWDEYVQSLVLFDQLKVTL